MIIALISRPRVHAPPIPAENQDETSPDPSANRNSHAPFTVSSCHVNDADARNRNTVAQRDTLT